MQITAKISVYFTTTHYKFIIITIIIKK